MRTLSLLLLAIPLTASAGTPIQEGGNLDLGLGGGTHVSGLSGKYFFGSDLAGQAVVGWWGAGRGNGAGGLGVSGDLLFEQKPLFSAEPLDIAWNLGPGVNLGLGDATWLGINGVLGLEFNFKPVPVDLVLEYRPAVRVIDTIDADLIGFGAHIRVYPF